MFICKKENNIHKIEGEKIMLINKICPMCGKSAFLRINSDQKKEFKSYACYGGLIQEKLKSFNDFEREFVKTGYCPECQNGLFMKELSRGENLSLHKMIFGMMIVENLSMISQKYMLMKIEFWIAEKQFYHRLQKSFQLMKIIVSIRI